MAARRPSDEGNRGERTRFDLTIRTDLARYLVREAPTGFAVGLIAVGLVMLVLWKAAPHDALLVWLATIAILTIPAPLIVRAFNRSPDPSTRIDTWEHLLTVAYGLAGSGWGAAAIILYPRVAMPYQLFLLFILGGAGVSGM